MNDAQLSVKKNEHYEGVEVDEIEIQEEPIEWPFDGIREPCTQQTIRNKEEANDKTEVGEIKIKEEPIDWTFESLRHPETIDNMEIHVKEELGNFEISNDETNECSIFWRSSAAESRLKTHIPSHKAKQFGSILGVTVEEQVNQQKFSIEEEENYEDFEVDEIEIKEEPIDNPLSIREPKSFVSKEIDIKEEPGNFKMLRSKNCVRDFIRQKGHKKINTGEMECEVCEKKFTHAGNLQRHMRNHTGEKPFECKDCTKKFAQGESLKRHMRTHTGEKPFECKVCKRKFTQSASLKRHMRTNTREKPYECNVCKKKYTREYTLKIHMQCHTGEKPFKSLQKSNC